MQNLIQIDDRRDYSLSEFMHIVKRVSSAVGAESPDDENLIYPGREVYFTIVDMLGYINDRIEGEFRITQTKSRHYHIVYQEKQTAKRKAGKANDMAIAKTAIDLEEMTGRLPAFANKPEILELVNKIKLGRLNTRGDRDRSNPDGIDPNDYTILEEISE